jgi:hypothetical protein
MAITNQERIAKALDLLKAGLRPFVEREMQAQSSPRRAGSLARSISARRQLHQLPTAGSRIGASASAVSCPASHRPSSAMRSAD